MSGKRLRGTGAQAGKAVIGIVGAQTGEVVRLFPRRSHLGLLSGQTIGRRRV